MMLMFCSSCGTMKDNSSMSTPTSAGKDLSLSDFSFLKLGMSYDEIKTQVGPTERDVGSGLYIFVYQLSDGRELGLTFADLDNLLGATLYNPQTSTREKVTFIDDQS